MQGGLCFTLGQSRLIFAIMLGDGQGVGGPVRPLLLDGQLTVVKSTGVRRPQSGRLKTHHAEARGSPMCSGKVHMKRGTACVTHVMPAHCFLMCSHSLDESSRNLCLAWLLAAKKATSTLQALQSHVTDWVGRA